MECRNHSEYLINRSRKSRSFDYARFQSVWSNSAGTTCCRPWPVLRGPLLRASCAILLILMGVWWGSWALEADPRKWTGNHGRQHWKFHQSFLRVCAWTYKKSVVAICSILEIWTVFYRPSWPKLPISAREKTSPLRVTKSSGEARNGVLRGLHGLYPHGKIKFDETYFFIMEKNYFEKNIIFSKNPKIPKMSTKKSKISGIFLLKMWKFSGNFRFFVDIFGNFLIFEKILFFSK